MTTFQHGRPNLYTPVNELPTKIPPPPPRAMPPSIPPPRTTPPEVLKSSWRPPSQRPLPDSPAIPPPLPQKHRNTKVGGPKQVQLASPPLSLTAFVEEYSKQLPLQLKVLRGYCGPSSRLTISTDDLFNIHLVKRAKVVQVTDAHSTVYSVPLNSSIQFGLVYDPMQSRGSSEVLTGFKLRVSDMLVLDELPKVVACLKEYREGGKVVFTDGEKLVIRGVQRSRLKSKKTLKVFSLRTKQETILQEECPALFSTESGLVKMLLTDMLEYVEDPLPSGGMVHLDAEVYQNPLTGRKVHDLPDILLSRMVEMSDVITETSLISSAVIDTTSAYARDLTEEELHQMIDIPLEGGLLDVEVAVVQVDETDQLYEDTRGIYETYSPLKVKPMRDLLSDRSAAAQALFSLAVRTGWETHGIELDEPSYKYVGFADFKRKGSSAASLSGSIRSLASVGSGGGGGREEGRVTSPPKLPPRTRSKEEEMGRSLSRKGSSKFTTLPRNFKSPDKENAPVPSQPAKTTPSVSSKPCPPSEPTEHVQHEHTSRHTPSQPRDISKGQRSVSRGRNDDSLLDGSEGSCESGESGDDVVFGVKGQWEGLGDRIRLVEERVASLETRASGCGQGCGQDGGGDRWKDVIKKMENRIKVLEEELNRAQGEYTRIHANSVQDTPIYDVCGSSVQENKSYLKRMTSQQVVTLLEAMDLEQYAAVFKKEHISGDILAELDEEELKDEVGIQSKLHRIRLLKVISGQHSPANIISAAAT